MPAEHEQRTWGLWIDGGWRPAASGRTFAVENPKDASVLAEVAEGGATDIDAAVAAAQRAFDGWSETPPEARARVMAKAAEILRGRMDEFVRIEVDQTGRARRELAAQLGRLPEWYEYFGALARTHEDTVPPFNGPFLNYTRRVPLGVVGHVTPWNHPLLILTKKVAPSLAAGNSMVVKPSELAPLTPLLLGEVLRDAGLPDGVYNVVPGFGADAGAALTRHQGIRKIDLTGGTETGKTVASLAGRNLTRFAGELGGKAAMVAFPGVAPQAVVNAALFASFVATGQTCVQGSRLIVHRSIHDAVVEELVTRTRTLRLGDPQDLRTQVGPLVSERQRAIVEKYVRIGQEEGATLAVGGRRPEGAAYERGYWYLPTVFTGVRNDMRIAQEEIFGPVVCVMPFDDEEEAIALANGTEFGLAASVWTEDVRQAHRVAHRMQAGIVWINDHHRIDPASPWGGFKMSGIGRENGIAAYHEYTQIQNVIVNLSSAPFDWFADDGAMKRYS
ncbi:acyl-CoA reductase-like NAD-dependent aldehyde dehydrogenase [Azospirillum brasilense]|uniref:Acyl-CoA reductase-like NAD-dependent aldehyde dehydrogenase n=1 Tax=Azospirillum brasilense TaxID=192 RepID=A0A560BBZ7_AZOBR|nr:aldehyde dehydrogenase [Azospirillum brasilense]TWA70103.1 acyl-CoA reductase-like NAD-dependent aldehyde dehydrogenase [Azospirillum brasilense]